MLGVRVCVGEDRGLRGWLGRLVGRRLAGHPPLACVVGDQATNDDHYLVQAIKLLNSSGRLGCLS